MPKPSSQEVVSSILQMASEGKSQTEIASIVGLTQPTISRILERARKAVAQSQMEYTQEMTQDGTYRETSESVHSSLSSSIREELDRMLDEARFVITERLVRQITDFGPSPTVTPKTKQPLQYETLPWEVIEDKIKETPLEKFIEKTGEPGQIAVRVALSALNEKEWKTPVAERLARSVLVSLLEEMEQEEGGGKSETGEPEGEDPEK